MIALGTGPAENGESLSTNQTDSFDASFLIVFMAPRGDVREDRSVVKASASIQAERKSLVPCGSGRTRPGLASEEVLPARMDSSIHSDVFARHERSVLEIEHGVNDVRDFTHPSEGMKFGQRILIVVCVHWGVDISR